MKKKSYSESNKLYNRSKSVLAGGVHYNFSSKLFKRNLYFKKGDKTRLWDVDDNEYLDFYAKFGAMIFGHNHTEYFDSIFSEFTRIITDNVEFDYEVSKKIINYVPSAELVRYGLSGTEIIQNAIRLSRAFNKKNKFIRFEGHYHGNSDNIMGGAAANKVNLAPIDFPDDYRGTEGRAKDILRSQSYILPWNDFDTVEKITTKYQNEITAIILEPICINGGGILPAEGFLSFLRDICNKKNIILIFDEIITGFRVDIGGAQNILKVTPDLTTLGKAVSGGALPVSILVGKHEIMQLISNFQVTHAGTYNGYQLGILAVRSALKLFEKENYNCFKHMAYYGKLIKDILYSESEKLGIELQVQGHFNAMCLHPSKYPILRFADITKEIQRRSNILREVFLENGILLSPTSRIYLNTSIRENDIDLFEYKVRKAFPIFKKIIKH